MGEQSLSNLKITTMTQENTTVSIWDFNKYREFEWFRFLVLVLVSLGIIYVLLHIFVHDNGAYEYSKLDERQMLQINRIYFGDSVNHERLTAALDAPDPGNQQVYDTAVHGGTDDVPDRPDKVAPSAGIEGKSDLHYAKCRRVMMYINNEFNNKLDKDQVDTIHPYLCSAPALEAISFLSNVRLRVKSYFWLIGPTIYFEIIFWALFGVLGSLLFNLGLVYAARTTVPGNPQSSFDPTEIPSQIAKMLYAPLCTLVIVLGYNFFSDQNIVDISSSKGVIVFSFLGGFYSSRLIAFLDRLKEVILPTSGSSTLPAATTVVPTRVQNIKIDFQADPASIPPELLNEVSEIGFAAAKVTVKDAETDAAVEVKPLQGDQEAEFVIADIKPGRYIIEARWSVEVKDSPLNLEAKETVSINSSGQKVMITLRKTDAEG
jgi:hypothetical protein